MWRASPVVSLPLALRAPPGRVRRPPPSAAAHRPDTRPARRPDRPAEGRDRQAQSSLSQADQKIAELADFRGQALSQLTAQHEEIIRLRNAAADASNVIRLPTNRTKVIGPC